MFFKFFILLLLFCLVDWSIIENGVLKSPVIVKLAVSFSFVNTCLMHIKALLFTVCVYNFIFLLNQHFKYTFLCLMASVVSDEKLAVNIIKGPLYLVSHFFHLIFAAFKIFSLYLAYDSVIIICFIVDFFLLFFCL